MYVHYAGLHPICETVQSSRYSRLVGAPVALIGLISCLLVFVSLRLRGERALLAGYSLTMVAFAFSVYAAALGRPRADARHRPPRIQRVAQWRRRRRAAPRGGPHGCPAVPRAGRHARHWCRRGVGRLADCLSWDDGAR